MRLSYAILLSLVAHLLALKPSLNWSDAVMRQPQPRIMVSIEPVLPPKPSLQDSATEASPPSRAATQAKEKLGKFQQQAQRAISQQLLYPPEAIERGLEGDVTLLLILDSSGRVQSAEVARSSGHALLDAAALSAAKRLGRLPGNPRESLVPISFRLD